MLNRFLETKFHIPPLRSSGVSRPRLLETLRTGLLEYRKLSLVSAPAGYGKTTLVAEWIHTLMDRRRVAWLSLDETDNDPARFLGYWIVALNRADQSLAQSALSLLGMPQIPPLNAILDELINDLAKLDYPLVMVWDDYHMITNPQLYEAVEYFVERQPPNFHLAVTTRVDPALPLSRLRVRGQMTEIRANDLRFTQDEACEFFSRSMKLNLEAETVAALEARTEGWAAGLQLAALALQNLPDQRDFLADFSGSHRYVIDYLLDEVLKRQSPEIREFLGKTALLTRFNADLCGAVTGNSAAGDILLRLELSNLFLIPLDDRRGWYRYHHLFADVLRADLSSEIESESRIRAARWFETQGLLAEAISNWLAVPDADQAARLIGVLAADLLKNGEIQTLLGWLNALPETVVNAEPDLVSYRLFSLLMTGQINPAQEYARRVLPTLQNQTHKSGYGRLLAIQAWLAMTGGDTSTGEVALSALAHLDQADRFFRVLAMIALGSDYSWKANLPAAGQVFREAYQLARQMGHPFISLGALANLAFNLFEMGQLREAEALCRAVLDEYVDSQGNPLPILGIIYSPLATICFEKGDFDDAQAFAQRGIALSQRLFSSVILGGDSEIILARIALKQGQPQQAFNLLQSTETSARERNAMMVVYKMAIGQADLHLLLGEPVEAEIWLDTVEAQEQSTLPKIRQLESHLRARYWVATGQPKKALQILAKLEQFSREEGCHRRLIGVHLTQALTYQKLGDSPQAVQAMEAALRLAAPEGYASVFFPHPGLPTLRLLQAARAVAPDFVDGILSRYPATVSNPSLAAFQLPEPLTDQERRVLQLIVSGNSNHEIADELVISVGTAKWHVHNVLQKLGVSNRQQAIARAREFGIT